MQYRTYKAETLSEIGIGCYSLSGAYGKKDPERFIGLVRRAHELGVTLFDTADQYGPAEEILGRAVAPIRDEVWVATKVGITEEGGFDLSAEHVRLSCEQSLQRLQTDVIDLYQIHFDDPDTPVEETLQALEKLKAEGKIRHYGVGHLPYAKLERYLAAGNVFSELAELSPVARSARERTLPLCQNHGVGVIAFSVTGRGLLTGKIGPGHQFEEDDIRRLDALFQRERFASGLRVTSKFRALGEEYGKTPVQAAIAWTLAQPGVICALTGPSTLPHLEENLGGSGWSIAADDLDALERFFKDEDVWLVRNQIESVRAILDCGPGLRP
jgi:aryl-alcohol dehydrogenase-like predicted oxidoreductase